MAKQKGKPARKRHRWKYNIGARWGRKCVDCGARQRIRSRPRKNGRSYMYGSTAPEIVTVFPDGTTLLGDKIGNCHGGRR